MATGTAPIGYVYLIGSPDSRLVKIGRSVDPERRLADIQRMSPTKLAVLWRTEGGPTLEAALHRRFKTLRSHGEWFSFPEGSAVEHVKTAMAEILAEHEAAARQRQQRLRRRREALKQRKIKKVWSAARLARGRDPRIAPTLGQPFHRQVADYLRSRIRSGNLGVGDAIPSTSRLAAQHGVSVGVVRAAVGHLQAEGILDGQAGKGVYVAAIPKPPAEELPTLTCIERQLADIRAEMRGLAAPLPLAVTEDLEELEAGIDDLSSALRHLYGLLQEPYPRH